MEYSNRTRLFSVSVNVKGIFEIEQLMFGANVSVISNWSRECFDV
jgi:hypothetical protein